jgi:two-component system, OmpR family, sensor kinase
VKVQLRDRASSGGRRSAAWSRMPLWAQLVLGTLGLAAIGLSVTGIVGVNLFRDYLVDQSGQQLNTVARTIAVARAFYAVEQPPNCGNLPSDNAVELFSTAHGATMFASCGATVGQATASPTAPSATALASAAESGQPITQTNRIGSAKVEWQFAVVRTAFRDAAPKPGQAGSRQSYDLNLLDRAGAEPPPPLPSGLVIGYVLVATPLSSIDVEVNHLVDLDIAVDAAVLLALLGLGYVLVHRTLRPLRRIETAASAISAGDLTQRMLHGHPKTEIGRLSRSLNGMLGQIESAFSAQADSEAEALRSEAHMRQFAADAGHELRTPLASIRGITELYRQGAADSRQVPDLMRRIENEAIRMGLLVEDLLLLARLDQERPFARDRVHLVALAADSITAARARSADRTIELRVERPSRALGVNGSDPDIDADAGIVGESVVIGDENRLRQALDNLLTNAVRHTPADTPITVRVRPADAGGHCLLEVADTGPGLSADDAAHVFERFYRSDPSRARTSTQQGSGLGLAIVAAIAQAHGGSATVRSRLGHGACFTLSLPAAVEVGGE